MKFIDASIGRRPLLCSVATVLVGAVLPVAAIAETPAWPTKPVRIIVPTPQGASDTLARIIGPKLEAIWKQPVLIEQKPGAGGMIGSEYVANVGDSHVLLMGTQSALLPKFTRKELRYDPLTDLTPIYKIINYQMVLATNAQTAGKARTLADVVALSKSTDKGVFFAGTSPTGVFNLSMALLNQSIGVRYSPVNYNTVQATTMALLRDDAQLLVTTPSSIQSYVDAGTLVPLAVANKERYPNLPNVPTIFEAASYKGYVPVMWSALFGPKGMPAAVAEKVGKDVLTVINDPAVKKQIEIVLSGSVQRSSPAQFAGEYREEAEAWKNLIHSLNLQPE
jgi:tripartite-type tricarboxylate transporter receptor subunit TctC